MAIVGVPALISPVPSDDTSLPFPVRDALVRDDNGGVRYLFDLAFPWCYPGGPPSGRPAAADPGVAAVITDMAERAGAGGVNSPGTNARLTYAGGGFDFSGVTVRQNIFTGPAAALADIWSAAPAGAAFPGASQRFLAVQYCKLPLDANFNTGTISPIFSASFGSAGMNSNPELVLIGLVATRRIEARRQTAVNAAVNLAVSLDVADLGTLAQIAYWRNADGVGLTVRTAAGRKTSTGAVGADNSANFSARVPTFGVTEMFVSFSNQYQGYRCYRGFIENLARSGRSPIDVLEADWDRVIKRNVFS